MKKKKEFGLFTVVFITFMILSQVAFVSAITGSMGNARMVLYPEVNGLTNTIIDKSILVKNVNDVPIIVKLEVDEDSTDFLEIIDTEVELEPGTEKRMAFKVKVKKPGRYDGKINVFFSEIESKGPGVALSSNIIVIAKNPNDSGSDDQVDDNENDNSQNQENPITGEVVSENSREKNPVAVLLITSTIILAVALIILYLWSEKKRKKKVEEIKEKKSKKTNETSKKKSKK